MEKQEKNDQISREDILHKIMKSLGPDDVPSRTVLVGEAGIGKTWLAKEVSERFTKEKSSMKKVIWLHLNKRIKDEKSLCENLAAQLSLFPEFEEGGEYNELEYSLESFKKKIEEEMIKINKKNHLLLILDDEGRMTTEKDVMKDINLQAFCSPGVKKKNLKQFLEEHYITVKTLVTKSDEGKEKSDEGKEKSDEGEEKESIKVVPLTKVESKKLLCKSKKLLESLDFEDWPALLKILCNNEEIEDSSLMSCILSKSKHLPAAIVVLNNSLDSIKSLSVKQGKSFKELILPYKSIFEKLILSSKSLDAAAASKNPLVQSRYNPVLRLSYELLKPDETVRSPVIACFWHVLDFYKYSGCAYYRDLIVHWMLEGYFDPVKSVEKAYQDGHSILMEFMNRGILKIQEDNMVVPEYSMRNLLDIQDCGFFGRSCLGFDRVYGGDKSKGLGKIIVIDDMIQTIQSKEKKIKTIITSGNRLRREVPGEFFEKPEMQDLEVVVLFEPTFHDLVLSLSKLKKLRVLVIRDCDLIKNIDDLTNLEYLHVLEVSGASSLSNIPDDFFQSMTKLQSLNLSGLAITSSPSTIEKLSELRCFILRDCSELQDLPNFNVDTKKLEVIDIHGAGKLKSYFDRVKNWKDYKGKNKNFAHLRLLEHLDFSQSQIIRLPIFHLKDSKDPNKDFSTMPNLTRLLVRNCTKLRRLPQLKPLINLQILDVHGATGLVEMLEVCLEEKKELRILDISETSLPELADTIADVNNLNQLLIQNCSQIEELPSIENLTHLEVFNVSGCDKLKKINGSFGKMSYLHKVNLSGTALCELPDKISELSNLKELILSKCSSLKALPNLEKLTHLEIFDVSGCTKLDKIEGSFENMSYLHEVNLSGTNLGELPNNISEVSNLKKLIVRNCSKLKALPNLEKLTHLEVFDVSGCTELDKIEGSFESMSKLCEVNLSETKLKTIPELPKPSILCFSKRIVLADSSCLERAEWSQIKKCLAINSEGFSFFNVSETRKKGEKLVHQGERYRVLDPEAPEDIDIVDINRTVDPGTESIAKAEYVSIADNESTSVSSIFHEYQIKSVKGCWVERCKKMENIFKSNEEQDKEKSSSSSSSLENLWISNLPFLTVLCSSKGGFIFENLKKLSIDCCPRIKVLFPEVPKNLEILRVKFCDQLDKLFEVEAGELSKLHKLYLLDLPVLSTVGAKLPNLVKRTIEKCPKLKDIEDELRPGTRITEEISEVQPHTSFGSETQTPTQITKATDTV